MDKQNQQQDPWKEARNQRVSRSARRKIKRKLRQQKRICYSKRYSEYHRMVCGYGFCHEYLCEEEGYAEYDESDTEIYDHEHINNKKTVDKSTQTTEAWPQQLSTIEGTITPKNDSQERATFN